MRSAVHALEAQADRASAEALRGPVRTPLGSPVRSSPALPGTRRAAEQAGGGHALEPALRVDLEARFGHDFSRVRVHADGAAARATQQRGALALADGEHLLFGAGQWRPHTDEGRGLLAHELAHVVQQRSGAPAMLRKTPDPPTTRNYDTTLFTIADPEAMTLAEAQALTAQAITDGALTAAAVRGAVAGTDEEILLHYALAQVASADRWNAEIDIVAPIGFKTATAAAPRGRVTVRIDEQGKGEAELVAKGGVTAPALHKKKEDAVADLKAKYGLIDVADGDAVWTLDHLNLVVGAFARLSATEKVALKGVKLVRKLDIPDAAGVFESEQSVEGSTVVNTAELQLDDGAFPASGAGFIGGAANAADPAYLTILHEVGHALQSKAQRDAMNALFTARAARNEAVDKHNTNVDTESSANDALTTLIDDHNALVAEQAVLAQTLGTARTGGDAVAIAAAQADLDAKKAEVAAKKTDVDTQRTVHTKAAAAAKTSDTTYKGKLAVEKTKAASATAASALPLLMATADKKAQAARTALTTARAAAGSSAESQPLRDAVADAVKKLDGAAKAIGTKNDPTKEDTSADALASADEAVKAAAAARDGMPAADPALAALEPVQTALQAWLDALQAALDKGDRPRRVQAFVEFVEANHIEPFTAYARDNWPDKPDEFYAEAYTLFLNDPAWMQRNQAALHGWFTAGSHR